MTRLEIAAVIMQGLVTRRDISLQGKIADVALRLADELLNEYAKTEYDHEYDEPNTLF